VYSDPFYRITYLIKEEIRKYKWIEGGDVSPNPRKFRDLWTMPIRRRQTILQCRVWGGGPSPF
jgi:hypothetical protein